MDSQSSSSLKFIRLLRVVSSSHQRPNQPRPQGLLAFQYGGGRREDPPWHSLRSKRFRLVSEQRKTEERDPRFWPREK